MTDEEMQKMLDRLIANGCVDVVEIDGEKHYQASTRGAKLMEAHKQITDIAKDWMGTTN